VADPPIVPYEAAAAFCMILLQDHRMLTVHFVGMPPGTANILFKFVRPETLERFGGAQKFAQAVDAAVTKLGTLVREPERFKTLLLGDA
jgi:L-seryl-tRNA(Ser) seleniumtransferase